MPGRLFLERDVAAVAAVARLQRPDGVLATPRRNIAPGQEVLVFDGTALVQMRWGIVPAGRVNARGRPVMETIVNARSETLFDKSAFDGVGRGVVPADGWYEWTGRKGRRQAWRVRPVDGGLLGFAAITDTWTAPDGRSLRQVATVTCAPNADVAPIHDRMGVLLRPENWRRWIEASEDAVRQLLRPWPDGRLTVEKADDVDWTRA